jgi:hypothetical protein
MMGRVLQTLLDMMRLKSGPQDLPADSALAVLLALLYFAQGFIASQVLDEPDAAPRTVLAIAVQFGVITALLNFRNLSLRLHQTISALAGTGFMFGMISLLLLVRADSEKPQPELALLYLALFIWSIAVDAHIYRHALSTKMTFGVLIAVMIFLANYILLRAVFG